MHHALLFNVNQELLQARSSGSHRIATHLRNQNWDVEVVDFCYWWDLASLQALARSRITKHTRFLGFSFIFSKTWTPALEQFCQWVRNQWPDIKLIYGSQQVSFINTDVFDYYVVGYGEHALDVLLKYLFSNGETPRFNVLRKGHGQIIDAIHNYPAYPMADPVIFYQDRDFIEPGEWLGIEFSRGCVFQCLFCDFPVLGVKGDYTRHSDSARRQMMDAYDRWGVENYFVSDETFNDRVDKIVKFADMVETLPWRPFFTGYIRADLMVSRPQDRVELARMGFLGHYYGVETFNHESGKAVGKGMHPDRLQQGLLECKDYFEQTAGRYRGTISLIAGLPHETLDSWNKSCEWLKQHWLDRNSVSVYPLQIGISDYIKKSKLSMDYKKLGYVPLEEFDPLTTDPDRSVLNWGNEHMTLAQAEQLVSQLKDLNTVQASSQLSRRLYNDCNTLLNLDQVLAASVITDSEYQVYLDRANQALSRYIHKKLSI